MGKQRAPAPPDPVATANAQGAANAEAARVQARMNRGDTFTPFGNVRNVDLGNDRWATYVEPSEGQLEVMRQGEELDRRTGQLALDAVPRAQEILNTPLNTDGLPQWQSSVPDRTGELVRGVDTSRFGQADISRDAVERAIMSRLEPQFQRDREALEGRLISQGFQPGTEAYQRAADELNRARTDARMQAVLAGGQEQSRIFGLGVQDASFRNQATGQATDIDLARAGFNNNTRGAMLGERLQMRAQPINEISALFGLGPGMQMPQPIQQAQVGVAAPDYQGLVSNNYQQQVAGVNARNAATAQLMGSALGAAGSWAGGGFAMPSDRRLKRDVQRIGTGAHGLPVYTWTYVWGEPGAGFMADEVAQVRPEAVGYGPDGFAWVNYAAVA